MQRLALGLMISIASLAAPALARAAPPLAVAGDGDREDRRDARRDRFDERHHLEDFQREPQRKGFYVGGNVSTGATLEPDSFIPSVGWRLDIGGGLTDRLTLGVAVGFASHLGVKSGFAGVADLVVRGFVHRGLFLQLGVGATSHAPQRDLVKHPGIGGIAGIGYEFRPLRVLGISLGADYEGRVRTDGVYTQAVVVGVGLRAYFDFPRR